MPPQGMPVPPQMQKPQGAPMPEAPKPQGAPMPEAPKPQAAPMPEAPKPQAAPMPEAPKPQAAPMPQTVVMPKAPMPPQGMPGPPQMQKPQGAPMPQTVVMPKAPMPPQGMPGMMEMTKGNLVGQLGTKPIPHLVRKSTGEIINITKPEFVVGKSKTKADYAIANNSAISREHCIIVQRDGVNYIKDNNSTNHTYVNGVELQPGKEVLLKHKTDIRMGDEEFTFLLRKGD